MMTRARRSSATIDWEATKRTPIKEVARRLRIALDRTGRARCPLPDHRDTTPSFQIYPNQNSWYCFGCFHGGSVIDLVMYIRGVSNREAAIWIKDNSESRGNRWKTESDVASSDTETPSAKTARGKPREGDSDVYDWVIERSPMSESGWQYLHARGISKTTIREFRLGQFGSIESLVTDAIAEWGFERIENAGLLSVASTCASPRNIFSDNQIIFPFWCVERCEYIQARRIDERPQMRWVNPRGIRKPLYNIDVLLRRPIAKKIYICEGVIDVLSAHELRWDAIGVLGASSFQPEWLPKFRGRDVHIIPDRDDAGNRMASRLKTLFIIGGISVVVQRLPVGNDVNEYLLNKKERRG